MHEMGIMASVLEAVTQAVEESGATRLNAVTLAVGDMTETVPDALHFAFDALAPGTVLEGSRLVVETFSPRSRCLDCGFEYDHDRFQMTCPQCGSFYLELLQGRELHIASIDVDLPASQKE